MIAACLRAELFKLRRRPAVWVLAAVFALSIMLFGYVLIWALSQAGAFDQAGAEVGDALIAQALPERVAYSLVQAGVSFGGAIVLILGALAVGSEHNWGTVKTMVTQRPGRGSLIAGQLLAVVVVTFSFAVVGATVAALSSAGIALLESAPMAWPSLADMAQAVLALWLLITTWAMIGAGLASLFRGTGLAIGIGLVWAILIDNLLSGLPFSGGFRTFFGHTMLTANANALSTAFGDAVTTGGVLGPVASPEQAVAALLGWLFVFAALTVAPFVLREVR
jgi:ABC-2 type transport system permease protein